MKIGYARVSTQDQKLELQTDELKKFGCDMIFKEKVSGKKKIRPELNKMIEQLRQGDIVVVWKLDTLGRSLKDLIGLVASFRDKGVEFERENFRERTKAVLEAAKARGRKGGKPKERLNGTFRRTVLNAYWFEAWMKSGR
jgi:DNA invertase Pin-like site-specific DNA recombinase